MLHSWAVTDVAGVAREFARTDHLYRVTNWGWKVAAYHGKKDDSAAPNVHIKTKVALSSDHFRRSVARATTCSLKRITSFVGVAQSKIDNFNILFVVEE